MGFLSTAKITAAVILISAQAASLAGIEAPSISAVDALGRRIVLAESARRVISLTPTATEILFAVGAERRVVGITEYCNYPPEAQSKQRVGGFSGATISVEQIVSLKPDLVLVSRDMHGKVIALLEGLGVRTFALEPGSFAEVYRDIRAVGTLTGQGAGAEAVVADMERRIAAAAQRHSGSLRPGVFWELWDDPLMTAGSGTFVSEAIALAGGRNVFDDLKERWPTVSLEQVLLRRPDWIIAGDDHGDRMNLAAVAKRSGWAGLPAVRNGRIAVIDSDIISRGGPRLADAVEALADILR